MSEMQQLKAKVKELNAKQIALNKEKAELDAKVICYCLSFYFIAIEVPSLIIKLGRVREKDSESERARKRDRKRERKTEKGRQREGERENEKAAETMRG